MTHLVILPLLIPLIAGFSLLFIKPRNFKWKRLVSLVALLGLIILSAVLIDESLSGVHQIYLLGNWPAPFGIVLVLDQLSALMITVTVLLAFAALIYAIATDTDKQGKYFHVAFQLLIFGLNGAFLTGDLFNLFVFFEVLLLASYILLLHGGGRDRIKSGLHYVVINLVGSVLFLLAVGTLYGIIGTLNIADMALKIQTLDPNNIGAVAAAGLLLLVVFGIKAALFPLYLWLPGAYTHTSATVVALFAIMTKLGIYAIIRVHGTIFGADAGLLAHYYLPWVLGLGLITLMLAAFGVMQAKGLREQVVYLVLASVSTLIIAVGINTPLALSGALYYLIHSTFVAGGLFLLTDVITKGRGSFADRLCSGPSMPRAALVGYLFMLGVIAIVGLPPLSGFFAKVLIIHSAIDHPWFGLILFILLLAGLMMLIALVRSGSILFFKTHKKAENTGEKSNRLAIMAIITLFAASPILVVFAQQITTFTHTSAQQKFNNKAYINAVLSKQPLLSKLHHAE